jgi:hypothetical protein
MLPSGLTAATLLALAACAPMTPLPPPPVPMQQCMVDPARWALGKAATDDVVERVRIDTHSGVARVIHPNDVITMEYSSGRVNVKVNDRNAIIGLSCG